MFKTAANATLIKRTSQRTIRKPAADFRTYLDSPGSQITITKHCKMSNKASEAAPGSVEAGTATSVFLVTSPDASTSRKIAQSILTKKLAACVNLVPKITSLYVSVL